MDGSIADSGSDDSLNGRAPTPEFGSSNSGKLQAWMRSADDLVSGAEHDLAKAAGGMEQLVAEVSVQVASAKEVRSFRCRISSISNQRVHLFNSNFTVL